MNRVVVVGGPGSGKSTASRLLASRFELHHVEVDALWWEPGWRHVEPAELRARVRAAMELHPRWVVDGNYVDELAEAVWPSAGSVVWLAVPRPVAIRRAIARTVRRTRSAELLWGTNRESLANLTPGKVLRLWRGWPAYDERIATALAQPWAQHLEVVRLSSADELSQLT